MKIWMQVQIFVVQDKNVINKPNMARWLSFLACVVFKGIDIL